MPRKRQIDPGIWTSEQFCALSPSARLLFIGLISQADDEGRLKGGAFYLKMAIFPGDNYPASQIEKWRQEIFHQHLATGYNVNGTEYIHLPTFKRFQYITRRFPSLLPQPPVDNQLLTAPEPVSNELHGNGIGTGNGIDSDNDIPPAARKLAVPVLTPFEAFWKAYPRKKAKGTAEKAWKALKPTASLTKTILAAVEQARASPDWLKDGGQFIPYPGTWLRARGWEDEITMSEPGKEYNPAWEIKD